MTVTYKKEIKFKAKLAKELYYNPSNAYGITIVSTKDEIEYVQNGYVTIVGTYCQLDEGIEYNVVAEPIKNEKYGWQYKVINMYCDNLTDVDTMKNYLYSIIATDKANLLLANYPDLVQNVVENTNFEPDYDALPGIGEKTFKKIKEKILNTYLLSEILALLNPIGVSFTMIKRIAESETNVSLLKQKILDNPYILTKIPMLSFKKVDAFAIKLHPDFKFSKFRMVSAIQYLLFELGENEGHSWVDVMELKREVRKLVPEVLNLFDDYIKEEQNKLANGETPESLYVDEYRCGLYSTYLMEKYIYDTLTRINNTPYEIDINDFEERIQNANEYLGFELSEQQCDNIKSIATHNVTVITGKAGTGKTSLIKGILSVYDKLGFNICTLSAKASRRVVEVTGFNDAKTIHRLLEYNPVEGFVKNEDNRLGCNCLIIDEASMVNTFLFYSIMKALPSRCKVIIVGDNMQLPAIGSGAVFTDILNTENDFNVLKLTKIYRQAEKSGIVVDANKIRDGIIPFEKIEPTIISGENQDMMYLFKLQRDVINKTIVNIYMTYINNGININDILVLLPRKDNCQNSTKDINNQLQALLIPSTTPFLQVNTNKLFYVGDRVLNTVNNYNKDIMNGEIGTILSVDIDTMTVDFDGNIVELTKDDADGLELGYALTVHKMQGSSAKYIIIGLDNTHKILLSSNLIYTAVTRSEKKCIVVSEPSSFTYGVRNTTENKRQTFLADFLI